jgi:hypothetical protein
MLTAAALSVVAGCSSDLAPTPAISATAASPSSDVADRMTVAPGSKITESRKAADGSWVRFVIHDEGFGDDWPWLMPFVEIRVTPQKEITIYDGGALWAVNGRAVENGFKRKEHLRERSPRTESGYVPLERFIDVALDVAKRENEKQ